MSHHLWEKWAAEQTENNLLKEKIQASGQGKGAAEAVSAGNGAVAEMLRKNTL